METMTISLPETLKQFIEAQVAEGGYGTASEYLQALVREDQQRKAQEKLEALLLEGLDSGPGIEATPEYWERKRAELLERHRKADR